LRGTNVAVENAIASNAAAKGSGFFLEAAVLEYPELLKWNIVVS
jgi:hypothetical protein